MLLEPPRSVAPLLLVPLLPLRFEVPEPTVVVRLLSLRVTVLGVLVTRLVVLLLLRFT